MFTLQSFYFELILLMRPGEMKSFLLVRIATVHVGCYFQRVSQSLHPHAAIGYRGTRKLSVLTQRVLACSHFDWTLMLV